MKCSEIFQDLLGPFKLTHFSGQLNEEQTANHLYLSQHVTMLASNSIAIVDVTSDVNVNYKAVIMQEDFEEMPRTGGAVTSALFCFFWFISIRIFTSLCE